jgi:hypothetical protein
MQFLLYIPFIKWAIYQFCCRDGYRIRALSLSNQLFYQLSYRDSYLGYTSLSSTSVALGIQRCRFRYYANVCCNGYRTHDLSLSNQSRCRLSYQDMCLTKYSGLSFWGDKIYNRGFSFMKNQWELSHLRFLLVLLGMSNSVLCNFLNFSKYSKYDFNRQKKSQWEFF